MDLFKITILYSLISTLLLVSYSMPIGKKLQIVDVPSNLNIHNKPVPLTGGIIFLNLSLLIFTSKFFLNDISFYEFIYNTITITLFFLIGYFDDRNNIRGSKRTLLFFLSSLFFVYMVQSKLDLSKIFFYNGFILNIGLWNIIFFSICVAGLQIVLNLIDGVNGLLKIYFLIFILFFEKYLNNSSNLISLVFIHTTILMLFFNFKNKFFLVSSGNSVITIITSIIIFNSLNIHNNPIFFEEIFLFFLIPFIDCLRLFIQRLIKFRNIFVKEKNHLHHILLKRFNHTYCLLIYFSMSILPFLIYVFFKLNIYFLIMLSISLYLLIIKLYGNLKK